MLRFEACMLGDGRTLDGFNGHPPLGVNATLVEALKSLVGVTNEFQWAPTLGGECYTMVYPS